MSQQNQTRSEEKRLTHVFTWRMFHEQRAVADSIEEASAIVLANRPAHIPAGTTLSYSRTVGSPEAIKAWEAKGRP